MTGLMFNDGQLLFKDGNLAFCETDCCDTPPPPPDCPECCTKLVGGEWVPPDGEVLGHWLFREASMTTESYVTVQVFGIGENSLVCDGQTITVRSDYHEDVEHGSSDPNHRPFVAWDRAWEYGGSTPELGPAGETYPHGLIKWDSQQAIHHIETSLKHTACWSDKGTQYGEIEVGWYNESLGITLAFSDCPRTISDCCVSQRECEPCCHYMPTTSGERNSDNDRIVFWGEDSGTSVRVALAVDPDKRIMFCEHAGGSVTMEIHVTPPADYTGDEPGLCIEWEGWWPNEIPGGFECPPPQSEACSDVQWTTEAGGWSTTITFLSPECQHECYQGVPKAPAKITAGLPGSNQIEVFTGTLQACGDDCCPEDCEQVCVNNGEAHTPCTGIETMAAYSFASVGAMLGTGSCEYDMAPMLTRAGAGCKWSGTTNGPFADGKIITWELEILAEDDAILKMYYDGKTFVWVPANQIALGDRACPSRVRKFNPLCSSMFQFSEALSDSPDCKIPQCLCMSMSGNCCDTPTYRDEPMPETLHADLDYCLGLDEHQSASFTLTWDPTVQEYKGELTVASGLLTIRLYCTCGTESGCGGTGNQSCYKIKWKHSTRYQTEQEENSDSCQCDPFEAEYFLLGIGANSCAAAALHTWKVTVTE